jgi:hypothetical protein
VIEHGFHNERAVPSPSSASALTRSLKAAYHQCLRFLDIFCPSYKTLWHHFCRGWIRCQTGIVLDVPSEEVEQVDIGDQETFGPRVPPSPWRSGCQGGWRATRRTREATAP